jgi:uncharacterized protein YbjQ (UPF0145 family)
MAQPGIPATLSDSAIVNIALPSAQLASRHRLAELMNAATAVVVTPASA